MRKSLSALSLSSLLLAALVLSACTATKANYRSNVDSTADFSSYRTYGFVAEPGTNRAGYSTILTKNFENAIRREMDARGYLYTQETPDLVVNFNANAEEKVDVRSSPSTTMMGGGYYGYRGGMYSPFPAYSTGTDVSTVRYKVGTANIDVVDARKKTLLWEGLAEGKLTKEVMANPQAAIDAVVTQLFAQFPGRITP